MFRRCRNILPCPVAPKIPLLVTILHFTLHLLLLLNAIRSTQAQEPSNIFGGGEFVRFTLFEGGTTNVVTHQLYNNTVVKVPLNTTTTPNFGLVAFTAGGPITAVLFGYNNITTFRRERSAPYCLCGNRDIRIDRCSVLGIGTHRVNATITNTGRSYVVTFRIEYDNTTTFPNPPPPPTRTPVVALPGPVRLPTLPVPVVVVVVPPPPPPTPVAAPVQLPTLPVPVVVVPPPVNVPIPDSRTNYMTFALIYTGNNTVATAAPLVNGTVLDLSSYPNYNFNIRVDTTNTAIKSVLFLQNNRVEVAKPWAYCGNAGELYNACTEFSKEGTVTVTVRLYRDAFPQLTVVSEESITFTILGKPSSTPPSGEFPILINVGGPTIIDSENRTWMADTYYDGGSTYSNSQVNFVNTENDMVYQSERYGNFVYEIPIPRASYSVILHFAEIYWTTAGNRVFDFLIEDSLIADIDILQRSGSATKVITIDKPVVVSDGYLTIKAMENIPRIDSAKLSAIEIRIIGPHYAHSVTGGPYTVVDTDGNGFASVPVDGSESHTHGPDETLVAFVWRRGTTVLARGEVTSLTLPVGEHSITLTVTDTSGDENTDTTIVTVLPDTFPEITSISPTSGNIAGGILVTINGFGFSLATAVRFGTTLLDRSRITIVNANTITVLSPLSAVSAPAFVSVITPIGESNTKSFLYKSVITIQFDESKLFDIEDPTAIAFGPDSKLYVGNLKGKLGKYTLNDDFDRVLSSIITTINPNRGIHGIAFDPLDDASKSNPTIYISTSDIFHNEGQNSFGDAINGKIQAVSGANLDIVTDVVTGLPVSPLDHSVNGIYFGDNGELYITVGSNTNGGIPGELSRDLLASENYFSAAILVANMGRPNFNGFITYDAKNNGNPVNGTGPNGVEVFASGLRNPYGIVLHSNGQLYATDNGPNPGFGDMATGCGAGQYIPDQYDSDELNLIVRNGWYGHPNHKRAQTDPRQCVWKGTAQVSTSDYTAPLMKLRSSTDGIIEYDSNHFNGELRHNLIASKYKDALYRIVLSADGRSVVTSSKPAIELTGDGGLAVTMAPNGNLLDARLDLNAVHVYRPVVEALVESSAAVLTIYNVFPRRGGLAGGSRLSIYGRNFVGTQIVVFVGTSLCHDPVVSASQTKITCRIPPSTVTGRKDVVVEHEYGPRVTYTLAYQYIRGTP